MPTSEARVSTENPAVYMKQLCRPFGHRVPSEWTDERGSITFETGTCTFAVEPGVLVLRVLTETSEDLARLEDVVGRHLERFAHREELAISWERSSSES